LVSEQKYQVFDNAGVPIGFVDVPFGMTVFDFDVMGSIVTSNNTATDENNPNTGVVLGSVIVIPALLVIVTAKKRKIRV